MSLILNYFLQITSTQNKLLQNITNKSLQVTTTNKSRWKVENLKEIKLTYKQI